MRKRLKSWNVYVLQARHLGLPHMTYSGGDCRDCTTRWDSLIGTSAVMLFILQYFLPLRFTHILCKPTSAHASRHSNFFFTIITPSSRWLLPVLKPSHHLGKSSQRVQISLKSVQPLLWTAREVIQLGVLPQQSPRAQLPVQGQNEQVLKHDCIICSIFKNSNWEN